MDKIKQFFGWVQRKQFWLLSLFIAIASTAVFAITASGLGAAISARIAAINTKYSNVQSVSSKLSSHPNDFSHAKMQAILKDLEKDVEIAWGTQYKRQEGLMTWPNATFRNEQKANIFRSLRPVEKFIEFPIENLASPLSLITDTDRGIYRDYVANTFPDIVRIIGTDWKATTKAIPVRQRSTGGYGEGYGGPGGMAGGSPGGSSSSEDPSSGYSAGGYGAGGYGAGGGYGMGGMGGTLLGSKDIVIWSQQSQQKLLNEILPWYDPKNLPSILEIYYTQEDIWLLNNIMEIIRRTNGDAREHFQAVIKEIEFIRMGKRANRDAGVLTKVQSMGGGSGDMYGEGGMGGSGEMSGGSSAEMMYGSEGGMGGGAEEVDPADGRYISFATENFFEPRVGSEIRESMKSIQAENAVDAVAKRVPIRIRVKMDPSKLHQFITQCGNAPFMLEVFQVRINTAAATEAAAGGVGGYGASSGYGGGSGGYGGGSDPSSYGGESSSYGGGYDAGGAPGGYGSDPYGGGSSGYGAGGYGAGGYGAGPGGTGAQRRPQPTTVSVEIYGLIYLYNPYDKQSLGGSEEVEADPSAESEEQKTPLEELNEKLESENALPDANAQPSPPVPAVNGQPNVDSPAPNAPVGEQPPLAPNAPQPGVPQPASDQLGTPPEGNSNPGTPTQAASNSTTAN